MTEINKLHIAGNGILFRFEDAVNAHGMFKEQATSNGIAIISNVEMTGKMPRWGRVEKVGPSVRDASLVQGARILIEPLRWSLGIKLGDGTSVWKTDEVSVLAVEE